MADATLPDSQLRVTQHRSAIGAKPKQRGTLRALGLGRIGRSHLLPDRPEIPGMLAKVPHLGPVEGVAPAKAAKKVTKPAEKAPAEKAAADEASAAEETDT